MTQKWAERKRKILLTATPLQNSLLELYGLVSVVDDHVFGGLESFRANYARVSREQTMHNSEWGLVEPKREMFTDLRNRLKPVCIRTLRKQVLEYIKYTKRIPLTQDYVPTEQETEHITTTPLVGPRTTMGYFYPTKPNVPHTPNYLTG